jgi:hypothetical protein
VIKLKNLGEDVHVYKPAGDAAAVLVAHGETLEVPGEVTSDIVGEGDDARAFPKDRWSLDAPKASSKAKADGKAGDNTPEEN